MKFPLRINKCTRETYYTAGECAVKGPVDKLASTGRSKSCAENRNHLLSHTISVKIVCTYKLRRPQFFTTDRSQEEIFRR